MRTFALVLIASSIFTVCLSQFIDYPDVNDEHVAGDRAAPWWVQKEEAKRRECRSSCTQHSKGVKSFVNLCDDTKVCPKEKAPVSEYATKQCSEWVGLLDGLITGEGRQVKHQPVKGTWMACAIFCKTGAGAWYAPRKELANLNVDAYFPDGVWCHRDLDSGTNYYCQNNLCLPEAKP